MSRLLSLLFVTGLLLITGAAPIAAQATNPTQVAQATPVTQIKEFRENICMKFLEFNILPDGKGMSSFGNFHVGKPGKKEKVWEDLLLAAIVCGLEKYAVGQKNKGNKCSELAATPEVQAMVWEHFEACVPQSATEAANAWMTSESGRIKVLSVQAIKRGSKRGHDNVVVQVTWEALATPTSDIRK